jgi:voltage-gated potassium channel
MFKKRLDIVYRYFEMPPSNSPTLPELLVVWTRLPWLPASLAIGLLMYLFLVGLVIVNGDPALFLANGNWWYYTLLNPTLTIYLLLMRPASRQLLNNIIKDFRSLFPSSEAYERWRAEAHILNRRQEWLAVGLGALVGWLLVRPWENLDLEFILYDFLSSGVMFGLLGWTIYHGLATTRFLATLRDHVQHFRILRPGKIPPLTRWSVSIALFFIGGMLLAMLFIRPMDLLEPENLIINAILLLVVTMVFLRSGVSTAVLARFRILRAFILFAMTLLVGTLGYRHLEDWSLMDGLYMTVITMTTIGYGETGPLSETGRAFTILLSLISVGIGGYAISTVAAFIVEGDFQRIFRGNKMDKQIAQLENHIILCGAGRIGMQIAAEFYKTRTPFVVIERKSEAADQLEHLGEILYLHGDATKDETLRLAGVERANGLIVTLGDDKDNAFIVLSGRSLNPKLRIVARLADQENAEKLRRVGADEIISPHAIGGLRMASLMIRPAVVTFLDEMMRIPGQTLRFEEVNVDNNSSLIGRTLVEIDIGRRIGLLVVAIKSGDGHYQFNPTAQTALKSGDVLIVIGTPEQLTALQQITNPNLPRG